MKSALIAACVAAVVSAGSAVAATKLIDGHSIKNHTISATKLTASAVASLQGRRGPGGATGHTGPQGPPGPATTFTYVRGTPVEVAPETSGSVTAQCPSGSVPVGGTINGPDGYFDVSFSDIDVEGGYVTGWDVIAFNPSTTDTRRLNTIAICASSPPIPAP